MIRVQDKPFLLCYLQAQPTVEKILPSDSDDPGGEDQIILCDVSPSNKVSA